MVLQNSYIIIMYFSIGCLTTLQKLTRTSFVVFTVFIVSNLNAEKDSCSVFWQILSPLILGNDIQLVCTATGKKCTGTFQWDGGPQKETGFITFDSTVSDLSKYSLDRKQKGHYTLTIKNLTERDLNISYTCHCGFYHFENVLRNEAYSLMIEGPLILHEGANLFANTSVLSGGRPINGTWIFKRFSSTKDEQINIDDRFSETRDDNGHRLHIKSLEREDLNKTYKFIYQSLVFRKDLSESIVLDEQHKQTGKFYTPVIVGISIGIMILPVVMFIFLRRKTERKRRAGTSKDGSGNDNARRNQYTHVKPVA